MRNLILIACCAALAGGAHAQGNDAREHYERGTVAFDLQRYDEAAREYELAFAAHADPVLLFNLGQAYRMAGDSDRALRAYKTYLARAPEAWNRGDVERRIAELQRVIDQEAQARAAAPVGTLAPAPAATASPATASLTTAAPPAPARRPLYRRWWLWTAVGAGAAALAVGLGVGLSRPGYPAFSAAPTAGSFHW